MKLHKTSRRSHSLLYCQTTIHGHCHHYIAIILLYCSYLQSGLAYSTI